MARLYSFYTLGDADKKVWVSLVDLSIKLLPPPLSSLSRLHKIKKLLDLSIQITSFKDT